VRRLTNRRMQPRVLLRLAWSAASILAMTSRCKEHFGNSHLPSTMGRKRPQGCTYSMKMPTMSEQKIALSEQNAIGQAQSKIRLMVTV
jgi:hypothetical protein